MKQVVADAIFNDSGGVQDQRPGKNAGDAVQDGQKHDNPGTCGRRVARFQRMLQRLNRQFHEPGDQQCEAVGEEKKQRSAGIAPAERGQIRNKSGKVFNGCILGGCSGLWQGAAPASDHIEHILSAITNLCQGESADESAGGGYDDLRRVDTCDVAVAAAGICRQR